MDARLPDHRWQIPLCLKQREVVLERRVSWLVRLETHCIPHGASATSSLVRRRLGPPATKRNGLPPVALLVGQNQARALDLREGVLEKFLYENANRFFWGERNPRYGELAPVG